MSSDVETPGGSSEDAESGLSEEEPRIRRRGIGAQLRPILFVVPASIAVSGIIFPLLLALLARLFFPHQANGSLVRVDDQVVGSEWIGQDFSAPKYFHPRPSAAGDGYDARTSGGSNLGPANPKLRDAVRGRAAEFRRRNGLSDDKPLPIDTVTASASGLDPHISPANAALQVPRVASERQLDEEVVRRLVAEHTFGRQFGFLGEPRVAVLALNLALDRLR
jgi:K+-transporting ATPase ATPase C chain